MSEVYKYLLYLAFHQRVLILLIVIFNLSFLLGCACSALFISHYTGNIGFYELIILSIKFCIVLIDSSKISTVSFCNSTLKFELLYLENPL